MKKSALFAAAAILAVIFSSCSNCPQCPAEQGDVFMMQFQNDMYPTSGYIGVRDSYIVDAYTNSSFAACNRLYVGRRSGFINRTVIYFDVTSLQPINADVVSAYLTLPIQQETSLGLTITAYAQDDYWFDVSAGGVCNTGALVATGAFEYNPCWNGPWLSSPGGLLTRVMSDSVYRAYAEGTERSYVFSLTPSVIESWIRYGQNGPGTNAGLLLKAENEGSLSTNQYMAFYSTDETIVNFNTYTPLLTVYYRLP